MDAGDKLSSQQNAKIERQLREDRKIEARTVKILLLGMLARFTTHPPTDLGKRLRCRRVREVHHYQTDEDHTYQWLPN